MKKLKIALCKTTFLGPVSGADEILLNYAVHLQQAGHDISVVLLYSPSDDDQYFQRLQRHGVPIRIIVKRSLLFALLRMVRKLLMSVLFFLILSRRAPERLRRFWQIALRFISKVHYRSCRQYFAEHRPDVMHVFTPDSGAALLIQAGHTLGIPVLYHEMGTPHHMPMLADYYRRLEKVLPLCTEVAALSPRLASEWSVRFPFLPSVTVLPLIMDRVKRFDFGLHTTSPGSQIVFGFAARVEEGKGPLVLLDALAQVNRDRSRAVARIAGAGPQLAEVKARARALALGDACEFVGSYTEPLGRTAFMESLDVFVLPSYAEGTPNGVIEAMAHGVPVIASSVGGIPDIVDAASGILVPPGDSQALADAMLLLAQDDERRREMGAAARRRYEELFEPAVVVPLMLKIYGRLARNGHVLDALKSENQPLHPWFETEIESGLGNPPLLVPAVLAAGSSSA